VLDVGCGHGLFALMLAEQADRQVVGTDIDERKLVVARRAAQRVGLTNVRFAAEDTDMPPRGWDAISMIDVLYLLGREDAVRIIGELARRVAPGGVFLAKEIDLRPRWKYELARAQELAATRVFRITEGRDVSFVSPADIQAAMESAELTVAHVPLGKNRLHPHHLVIGRSDKHGRF
jgi:cyclopropane fatty-acyl-phospholipid synthase-like methyltransferase